MWTEIEFGLVFVVRAAAELDVVHRGRATRSIGRNMMELEEALVRAAAAVAAHEGAAAAIAEPDRALYLGRDMSRARAGSTALSRAVRSGELLLGEVLKEGRQCPINDRCRISVWDLVPQKILCEP